MGRPDQADNAAPPDDPDPRRALRASRQQFGLRHLMGLSVVLGVVFAAVAQAVKSREAVDVILAGLACGGAISVLGAFLALRLERGNGIGWALVGLGPTGLAVTLVGASAEFDPFLMVVVILYILPVLVGSIYHVATRLRAAQQEAMLWVLALAAERGRPLGPALRALAGQSLGNGRLRLLRVAECLDHGLALPDALDFVPRSAPASA